MHLDGWVRINWAPSCHQGYVLAHLLTSDKGWKDVHLLLLTAEHLDGRPFYNQLMPDCTLIGPMKMLLWAVMMVPVPAQPRLNIIGAS